MATPVYTYDSAVGMILRHSKYIEESHIQLVLSWLPDEPPATIVFANIGDCLLRLHFDASIATPFRDILDEIEKLMSHGDVCVQSAVATGCLEKILSDSTIRDTRGLVTLLGPISMAYCRAWDLFTGVNTPGLLEHEYND